ncbi:MAG: LysR family transcriptional regulator ArgP [Deferribacterales bacterium]
MDYKLLEAFAAVVEYGGFEKAADKLCVTQSAVSQKIKQLEEQSKSVLLVRSTPPVPTETGKILIAHYNKVKLLESDMEHALHSGEDEFVSLCVGLNADTLATWFFDAVAETSMKNNILLSLRVDDQEETHRLLKDGEAAGCISTRSKPMQGCSVTYLGVTTYRMYVAPHKQAEFFPDGFTAEALKKVPLIVYNNKDTLHLQLFKEAFGHKTPDYHAHYIPSVEKYLDAVIRGMGIGMMPHHQCDQLLKEKKLADAASPHRVETPLYWHRWNIRSKPLDIISKSLLDFCRR